MKKVLFCYDGPLAKDENSDYYGSAINDELLKRYEVIGKKVEIAIRVKNTQKDKVKNRLVKINKERYRVIECPNISSIKGLIFDRNKCMEILKKEIEKTDYIIARLPSMIGNLSIDIAKRLNKPYLVELVGCPWDALWNYSLKGKLFAPIMTFMTKKRVKNSSYVLYVTKEFLQKRYPTKGKSINCSNVILDNIDEKIVELKKQEINKEYEDKNKTITTTAAINVKYKGQKYVIKAINKLRRKGKIFEYWLIGGGSKKYLEKFVKKYKLQNQVKFLGAMPHEEVFKKLDNTDIYIQPSKQEGLPRSLIEAMSRGVFCIGSRTGGIPELLEEKYIFNKGKVNEIVKIIENLNKEEIIKQIEKNVEKSKEYKKEILEERRKKFYMEFAKNE